MHIFWLSIRKMRLLGEQRSGRPPCSPRLESVLATAVPSPQELSLARERHWLIVKISYPCVWCRNRLPADNSETKRHTGNSVMSCFEGKLILHLKGEVPTRLYHPAPGYGTEHRYSLRQAHMVLSSIARSLDATSKS